MVTAKIYASQLQSLANAIRRMRLQRKNDYLLHGSARQHCETVSSENC
ncbi:unnamed protein product [Haemonchus placei]|uniref:Transposase n=1 Tax=Haemonchus placei TaxID=6290 RepID=A0A0N4W6Z5_HAEPC|nr:unnamed protein product [Haemonchus placei]